MTSNHTVGAQGWQRFALLANGAFSSNHFGSQIGSNRALWTLLRARRVLGAAAERSGMRACLVRVDVCHCALQVQGEIAEVVSHVVAQAKDPGASQLRTALKDNERGASTLSREEAEAWALPESEALQRLENRQAELESLQERAQRALANLPEAAKQQHRTMTRTLRDIQERRQVRAPARPARPAQTGRRGSRLARGPALHSAGPRCDGMAGVRRASR